MLGAKNKEEFSWALYDWANSAFSMTVQATLLPIFFKDVAAKGLEAVKATGYWGYTQSIAMVIAVILAPILGAVADYMHGRKRFMSFFVVTGALFTSLLFFVDAGEFLLCALIYVVANVAFASANVFYDSFLIDVAGPGRMDWLSALGFAYGYVGGGLLFILNILMVLKPGLFGLSSAVDGMRMAFVSVGIWWFVFTILFFMYIKERRGENLETAVNPVKEGFRRVFSTLRELKRYKNAFIFLLAYWFYIDAVGTIIKMAVVYGKDVGVPNEHLMGALLLTQFIAFPFSMIYGKLAASRTTKLALYIAIAIYAFIMTWGYFLKRPWEFWILAVLVGTSQGGIQALSRSFFGRMIPGEKKAEFYGFFSVFSKFATVAGPALYGFMAQVTGNPRSGVLMLMILLGIGALILGRVEEARA